MPESMKRLNRNSGSAARKAETDGPQTLTLTERTRQTRSAGFSFAGRCGVKNRSGCEQSRDGSMRGRQFGKDRPRTAEESKNKPE